MAPAQAPFYRPPSKHVDARRRAVYTNSSATRPAPIHRVDRAQIVFLLSTLTEENYDRNQREIRLLCEQRGLDAYLHFIRRLILDSQTSLASTAAPSTFDTPTALTFRLLVQEIRRLARDPFLAHRFRDGIDKGDGDVFRDFDLLRFVDRVGLRPLERLILASAIIVSASDVRKELAGQAATIVRLEFENAVLSLSQNPSFGHADRDLSPPQVEVLLSKFLSDLPASGSPVLDGQQRQALVLAAQAKYGTNIMAPILQHIFLTASLPPDASLVQTLCGLGAEITSEPATLRVLLERFGISESSPPTDAQVVQIITTLSHLAAEGAQLCDAGALIRVLSGFNIPINWPGLIEAFDWPERTGVDTATIQLLIAIILNAPRESEPHAIAGFWSMWSNSLYQLRLLDALLSLPTNTFNFVSLPGRRIVTVDDVANAIPTIKALAANLQGHTWNSLELFEVLVTLGDSESFEIKVYARDMLGKAVKISAELAYLGILQVPKPWNGPGTLNEYAAELLGMFLAGNPNDQLVFMRIWQIDTLFLIQSLRDYYDENPLNITRILDIVESINILDALWDILGTLLDFRAFTFALDVAALASSKNYLNLEKWLTENITNHRADFLHSVIDFLKLKASSEQRARSSHPPEKSNTMPLNLQTVAVFLRVLHNSSSILNEADTAYCLEVRNVCLQIHPRLVNFAPNSHQEPGFSVVTYTTQVETEVDGIYKQMYDEHITVNQVIQMLQRTKESTEPRDREIFSCMLHFLLGESKFFQSFYPPRKLTITGHLFGSLIQHSIVDGLPLSILIIHVLDALQCPPETNLFKFGVRALSLFEPRFPEWHPLCKKLLQIPRLLIVRPDLADSARRALLKPEGAALTKVNLEDLDGAAEPNHHVFSALKLGETGEESEWRIAESKGETSDETFPLGGRDNLASFHFEFETAVQASSAVETSGPLLKDPFSRNSHLCLDGHITRHGAHSVAAGGSADIWEGYLGDEHIAIKILRRFSSTGKVMDGKKLLRRLWREYLAWSNLYHPNVLMCLGFSYDFSVDSHKLPSLISPWMSNGTALTYLETHPDTDRRSLTDGIADGLCYLHTRDPPIVHGDIRAGNILISNTGVPCLSDFGLSRTLSEIKGMTTSSEVAGSMRWMSPELLRDDNGATIHSDVWAFGMTVLEILSGDRPYSAIKKDAVVFGQIINGTTPSRPEEPSQFSDHLWTVCRQCWSSPAERPAMPVVKSQLAEKQT